MSTSTRMTVRKSLRFSVVYDAILESENLSHKARVVLAWALGRQDGFECWIWYMCKRLGLKDGAWLNVRRELMDAGFFVQRKNHSEYGKFVWINEFNDEPLRCDTHKKTVDDGSGGVDVSPPEKIQRPAKPAKKKSESNKIYEYSWLAEFVRIDHTNSGDIENAKKISAWPRDRIEVAANAARLAEPSGRAYPTAVLRLLVASGHIPEPKPQPLSQFALAALAARNAPPKGMK